MHLQVSQAILSESFYTPSFLRFSNTNKWRIPFKPYLCTHCNLFLPMLISPALCSYLVWLWINGFFLNFHLEWGMHILPPPFQRICTEVVCLTKAGSRSFGPYLSSYSKRVRLVRQFQLFSLSEVAWISYDFRNTRILRPCTAVLLLLKHKLHGKLFKRN